MMKLKIFLEQRKNQILLFNFVFLIVNIYSCSIVIVFQRKTIIHRIYLNILMLKNFILQHNIFILVLGIEKNFFFYPSKIWLNIYKLKNFIF
jgi:hypothetical protein